MSEARDGGEELHRLVLQRREKLEALEERGIPGFAYGFDRSHRAASAVRLYEEAEEDEGLSDEGHGPTVHVAGRIVSWRGHGRSAFCHVEDESGRIQLYFRLDVLGDERFGDLELLDLGDWIGVEGPLFRTRTGEVTVRAAGWTLLSKALRPLPFGKVEEDAETGERVVHSGFTDREARYRQRYADLAVHPEIREIFRLRSRIVAELRRFMDGEGYLEVETPALQPIYGGASARPFVTHHHTLDRPMYLRIADELYLKRLIVGGFEKVYEIAHDFRNEGVDRSHNPEFTMLEFYEAFADYHDMLDLVERLVATVTEEATGSTSGVYQGEAIEMAPPYARIRFLPALGAAMGEDPASLSVAELRDRARATGIAGTDEMGRGKLLDKLFGELVEPKLVQPTFVLDHPVELSPLAKRHRTDEGVVERFELVVAGMEIANAFSELNDPLDQRARFEAQAELRESGDDEAQALDEDYLRALEYGMPPTGGVGIGVDRLVMILADQASIRDVILFPVLREEEG